MNCLFCSEEVEKIKENEFAYAIFDKYPVNKGHVLIITKRHIQVYFDTNQKEKFAIQALLDECKTMLEEAFFPRWLQYRHKLLRGGWSNHFSFTCASYSTF